MKHFVSWIGHDSMISPHYFGLSEYRNCFKGDIWKRTEKPLI
jgi:hypothetical protein